MTRKGVNAMGVRRYVRDVREAQRAVRDADEHLMASTSEEELEERNEAAWKAVEHRNKVIFGRKR